MFVRKFARSRWNDALIIGLMGTILALGGCVSTNNGTSTVTVPDVTVPVPTSAAEMISSIQGYAQTACGFLPAASFLTTLLGQGAWSTPLEYAKAICDAAAPKQTFSTRRSAPRHGTVNGVQVVGAYVR